MPIENDINSHLKKQGVDFIHFIDVSDLGKEQNKGFPTAILFGIALSPAYLKKVSNTAAYVQKMKLNKQIQFDEFHLSEIKTDKIADELAVFLNENGIDAYSQSEKNIEASGFYDSENWITPLPHKTIALMAGLGWIGKHNLLVTKKYGSGISMCSVLTNAHLETVKYKPMEPLCGTCNICVNICLPNALTGNSWELEKPRENVVNVKNCCTCFECVVHCPWTQSYMKQNLTLNS